MVFELRIYEDVLIANEVAADDAPVPSAIFLAAGDVTVGGAGGQATELSCDDGIVTTGARHMTAGKSGACLWRWEVAEAASAQRRFASRSCLRLSAPIPAVRVLEDHLLRLDSVAFPPGGCAYLHTHQGPGIRCLIEGTIRIDAEGHSAAYGPGSPWFEAGPDPVFAQADLSVPSRFIRVSVLPKELVGKSSIRYVNAEDMAKPKSQTYRVFSEAVLG